MEVVYVRWLDARGISGPVSLAASKRKHPILMESAQEDGRSGYGGG